ncbi:MAG: carboxymuconolactone decarboxylase family protein [Lysobacterales bacterium]
MNESQPRFPAQDMTPGVSSEGPLDLAIADFAAAAVRADGVDPVLTEMVRLRCAQFHDCRLCGSLRTQEALDCGFDESMQEKLSRHPEAELDRRTKAALALCDAMLIDPTSIEDDLGSELAQHFTQEQIVEICVDVMKWSQQKAFVALRIEPPVAETHLTQLLFDDNGHPLFGDPIPAE